MGAQQALESVSKLNLENQYMDCCAYNEISGGNCMRDKIISGYDTNGMPVYAWVSGKNKDELLRNAIYALADSGELSKMFRDGLVVRKKTEFSGYAIQWFSLYKEGKLRHKTLSGYRGYLDNHLIPWFGKTAIEDITIDQIQSFMDSRASYAKKTISEIMLLLKMILDAAIDDEIIQKNPAKSRRLHNPSTKKTTREALTEAEAQDILSNLNKLDKLVDKRFMAMLLFLPVRREEILGFQMKDINLYKRTISVNRAVTFKGNKPIIDRPKTEAGYREIPIVGALWDLLEISIEELKNRDAFIIGRAKDPLQPYTSITMRRAWERISSTIDVHGKTPHCFRHTFATYGKRLGIDEKTMQTIGGWKDIKTLRNVYTHTQHQDIEDARNKMETMYKPAN